MDKIGTHIEYENVHNEVCKQIIMINQKKENKCT